MDQSQRLRHYVNGESIATPRLFDDINPVDGSLVARIRAADQYLHQAVKRLVSPSSIW